MEFEYLSIFFGLGEIEYVRDMITELVRRFRSQLNDELEPAFLHLLRPQRLDVSADEPAQAVGFASLERDKRLRHAGIARYHPYVCPENVLEDQGMLIAKRREPARGSENGFSGQHI